MGVNMDINNVGIDTGGNTIKIDQTSPNNFVENDNQFLHRAINGEAYFAGFLHNATANWPALMLHNPTSSGKILYLDTIWASKSSSSSSSPCYIKRITGVDGGTKAIDSENKKGGLSAGVGDLYWKNHSYTEAEGRFATSLTDLANGSKNVEPIRFKYPFGITENQSIVIYMRADYNFLVTFEWLELDV